MSEHVHFIVTGHALTEAARNVLLSDEPGKAYRLLADSLLGANAGEAALQVLAGTHDLVGDSQVGIELVEADDCEEIRQFKQDVRYVYAGRWRHRGVWRRPVAVALVGHAVDGQWASKRAPVGSPEWHKYRALYWAKESETAQRLDLHGEKAWILFEACGESPHWHPPCSTAQEALDDALAAGRELQDRPSDIELRIIVGELADDRARRVLPASALRGEIDEADREAKAKAEEAALLEIGEKVRAQAGDDTFVLALESGRELTVPRAPFVRWALRRTDAAPEWRTVAPVGVKMDLDDPDHTDWVLGAGLTLDEAYQSDVHDAAWDRAFEIQEEARANKTPYAGIRAAMEMLGSTIHKAATVVDAGKRVGTVGKEILVLPDSEASRVHEIGEATGVIVEKGGKLAHFAIVTKGRGITVMRHPSACALFESGTRVELNPKTGRIVILERD